MGLLGQVLQLPRPPLGCVGPRGIGGRWGEEEERQVGGALQDGGSGEVWKAFPLPTLAPGSRLGSQASSPFSRVLSRLLGPMSMGGREKGGRGEVDAAVGVGGPSRTGGSGKAWLAFPPCTRSQEPCWASGSSPLPSGAPRQPRGS